MFDVDPGNGRQLYSIRLIFFLFCEIPTHRQFPFDKNVIRLTTQLIMLFAAEIANTLDTHKHGPPFRLIKMKASESDSDRVRERGQRTLILQLFSVLVSNQTTTTKK